jgi:hypothetical protein
MAADRVINTLAAAIFISAMATAAFAQQLDAAAPSPEPMPDFRDGDAGSRKLRRTDTVSVREVANHEGG